jgi:prolyl oligopeptidase
MRLHRVVLALTLAVVFGFGGHGSAAAGKGTPVAASNDPYLWLEDIHGEKALAWVQAQNARSRGLLKSDPQYQNDYDTILAVLDAEDRIPFGRMEHDFMLNFWQDAAHSKGIWRRTSIADYANANPHWDVLLDIDKLAADEHENWIWEGSVCAPSAGHCLLNLSRGGGDAHVVREFDLATKSFMPDGFSLPEAKAGATYIDDDTVLFATDFGPSSLTESGYPRILKLWRRGTKIASAQTVYEGKITDVGVSPMVFRGPDGARAFVARTASFFETEYRYVNRDGSLRDLPLPLSAVVRGVTKGNLIFTIRKPWRFGKTEYARGSLLAMPLGPVVDIRPGAAAPMPTIAVLAPPRPRSSVEEVLPGRDAVYAAVFDDVIGSIHAFRPTETGAWSETKLPFPNGGSTHVMGINNWGPEAQFTFESYLTPTTLYQDNDGDQPKPIKSLPARFDAANLTTEQFEAKSKDGTRIPYFVVRPKTLKASAPAVLYGYGGFEISLPPSYSANFGKLWLTKGGVFVTANIRGGGEFGPAWHDAALLGNRQKAFDDFVAVAQDLIARHVTTPKQLGIMGGSNGGLLVAASMVQRPDLFGAVVCQVPLTDMLRYTKIGAGASWAAEYGDPADPKARAALLKYSPYQNVKAGVKYPPVLFVTATSDDRVTPVHARKMAARMEAQGHDVLFYENTDGGHAAAADHKQAAEMWALSFVYLKQRLGL